MREAPATSLNPSLSFHIDAVSPCLKLRVMHAGVVTLSMGINARVLEIQDAGYDTLEALVTQDA